VADGDNSELNAALPSLGLWSIVYRRDEWCQQVPVPADVIADEPGRGGGGARKPLRHKGQDAHSRPHIMGVTPPEG
jgi:hypothetical protein